MTLEEKIVLVDKAREASIAFDDYFKELLGSGLSNAGAYIQAALKLEQEKPKATTQDKQVASPVKKPSATPAKVEKVNEQPSKSK